jgi:hypothetical protein
MKYLVERLSEASTWRGLVLIATSLGVGINPDLVAPITSAGVGVAGIVGVLFKDKLK